MKRLLLLSSEFFPGPGGIGTHAYQLAAHMAQMHWDVYVLTLQDYASKEEIARFNRDQQFNILQFPRTNNRLKDLLDRVQYILEITKAWHPDILVVTGDRQVWLAAGMQMILKIINRKYKLPWCAIWHGMIPQFIFARQIGTWAFNQADMIISVSQYSLQQLIKMGVRPRMRFVITNGADQNQYFPSPSAGEDFRENLGLVDAQIMLTVGHVTERKGQDIVIRALPEILKIIPNVHYLIAGLPTMQGTLEELAERLGVGEHVHFMGRLSIEMLNAAYNACDVFVLTSRHSANGEFEGFGIVVIESALCGKPSVVAANSGLVEAVEDGRTGFVVLENDPHTTALAIQKLLSDTTLKKQMGEQARRRALAEQTWSVCMNQYDQVFRKLIKST